MMDMFDDCNNLTTIDFSSWNTLKVTNMYEMFTNCWSLTTLDLSGWKTSNVRNMSSMFEYCFNLETIYVGEGWSTANVTNSRVMFSYCSKLPNWDGTTDATHANTSANGYLNKVKVKANSDGTNYWATYYNSAHSFKADDNTTVYQAKVNGDKDAVVLTEVTSKEIPADNGVVLKSSASSIILSVATTTATYSANDLKGTDVDLANPGNVYCLSNETTGKVRGVGFYSYGSTDGANEDGVIPAHRAYLVVTDGPTNSRGFLGFGEDDGATAIDNGKWKIDNSDGTIYDLSGRIVIGQPRKGIYVKDGKKFVIK
jgi:surface protein